MRPVWCPDLRGERVLFVASGPSCKTVPLHEARGRCRAVAINTSWELCPWADILYASDGAWWRQKNGVPGFAGIKVTQSEAAQKRFPDVNRILVRRKFDRLVVDQSGEIGDGGNSLFQAINIVVKAGPPRVMGFAGADMRLDYGVHWHGRHEGMLNNPKERSVRRWIAALDGIAGDLKALGITVLNLSAISSLTAYRKATLQEFLTA